MSVRDLKKVLAGVPGVLLLLLLVLGAGCTSVDRPVATDDDAWQTTLLTDVRSGKTFSISDFRGQTVFIQTFTITCPICMQQQAEISRLHAEGARPFVMVGLDIDPNSDPASLRDYTSRNGYYGLYASSPDEVTGSLLRRFGAAVYSPAQAPVIMVCPDGTATLLRTGIKGSEELSRILGEGCPG